TNSSPTHESRTPDLTLARPGLTRHADRPLSADDDGGLPDSRQAWAAGGVRAVRAETAAEPSLPGVRRARTGDRRPAPPGVLAGPGRNTTLLAGVRECRFLVLRLAPGASIRGRRLGAPRGDRVLSRGAHHAGRGPPRPGAVGRDVLARVDRLSNSGCVEG